MLKKFWIILLSAGLIAAVLIATSGFTIYAGEFAVVTSFGKPGAIIKSPGLYFKLPTPISVVNRFDSRIRLYQSALLEYLTGDKKNLILQTFVCWKIKDPLQFFQTTNNRTNAEQKLDDIVCSMVGSTLGDHEMSQIISTVSEQVILDEIAYRITRESAKRADDYGIEIVYVGFSRLALPEDNARSVYRRMIAERSAIANEYRALGRQKASELRAKADREKSDILAEAYKIAEITRGEGDALAANIYGETYSRAPEFFKFLRSLEADRKILNEKSTIILSTDSDLIKSLNPEGQ